MSELSHFSLETLKVAYVSLMIRLHSPLDWTERLLGDHDGTILGVAVRCFWRLLSCGTTDGQSVHDVDSRLGLRQRRVKRRQPDNMVLSEPMHSTAGTVHGSRVQLLQPPTQTRAGNSRKFWAIRFLLVLCHWSWSFHQPRLSNYGVLRCRRPLWGCPASDCVSQSSFPPFFSRDLKALLHVQMDSTLFVSIACCGFYFRKRKMGLTCKQDS